MMMQIAPQARAADSQTITFNITVPAVTCTVTPVDLPSVDVTGGNLIGTNWKAEQVRDMTVTLSACSGGGGAGKAPKLTIAPATGTTVSNTWLFRDSTSGSKGFGIVFYNVPSNQVTQGSTTQMVADGGAIWTGQTGVIPANPTIRTAVGVTCGATANCAAASLGTGTLKATVYLNLVYS